VNTENGTTLDWRICADATCAGLSVQIPLPQVDLVFATIFRRRIPGTISKVRDREIEPATRRALARPATDPLSWSGCLAVPFMIGRYILRLLWRKIIYIFAVKEAIGALAENRHRAFLIDHMSRARHLAPNVDTDLTVRGFCHVLHDVDLSPLTGLARQTVANVQHVLRPLVRARGLGAAEVTRSLGDVLSSHWGVAEASMRIAAYRYDALCAEEALDSRPSGSSSTSGARSRSSIRR